MDDKFNSICWWSQRSNGLIFERVEVGQTVPKRRRGRLPRNTFPGSVERDHSRGHETILRDNLCHIIKAMPFISNNLRQILEQAQAYQAFRKKKFENSFTEKIL